MLFVLDGSKALKKAVSDVFGKRALYQRCRVHKQRNVLEQLPEELQVPSGGVGWSHRFCTSGCSAMSVIISG